jgi:hypothetical protein
MTTLSVLPPELISCILQYVPDKMGCYMTCKSWGGYLKQMFKEGQLSDVNDSYYLMKFSKSNIVSIVKKIPQIHNHNCLNFLSSKNYVALHTSLTLLRQNCETNNISRPNYIYNLFEKVRRSYPNNIPTILDMLIDKKFYDMIKIISKHRYFLNYWARSFVQKNLKYSNINDEVKQEIITLIDMDIATPEQIYDVLGRLLFVDFKIWQQVLSFIKDNYKF